LPVRRCIFLLLIVLTVVAVPLQVAIQPTMVNSLAACIVLVSSLGTLLYLFWGKALDTHPLSSFTVLGFCFTSQMGALLVQTGAWTAISNSLYDPLYTFGMLALYQAVALLTHLVYRFFSSKEPGNSGVVRGFLGWAGLYRLPSAGALWIMGCIGLFTFAFAHLQNVVGKIAMGFSFLAWAPFLIPFFLREIGDSYCNAKLSRTLLIAYLMVACILGLALNTRAVMFQGVATIGLLYLLAGMRSDALVTWRAVRRIATLALVIVAISIPASYLATAMVVARQWRGKVSSYEMIQTTLFVMTKPNLIAASRAQAATNERFGAYDEHYIDNPLLNRLVTTKYHDNAFHFARSLTTEDARARLREISVTFAWAGLPEPVLHRLGIQVIKDDIGYSMGDYLAYLSRGVPLGGHKIGSMFAQGIALFGPLFPFIYAALCVILFFMADLMSVKSAAGRASLAVLGMLQIWNFFIMGISYESLHTAIYFVYRTFEQMVLIYVFVFGFARLIADKQPAAVGVSNLPTLQRG
jgi:hypothetical protein